MGTRKRAQDRGLFQREKGGAWYIRTDPLTGKQMSTKCRTLEAARRWRDQRELLAANPAHAAAEAAGLEDWIGRLVASKQATASEGTLHYVTKKLGHWLRLMPGARLSDVTPDAVDRYIATRREEGVTEHTISKEVTVLCQVLKLAKRAGCYPADIGELRPLDLHAGYKPVERWLTGVEVTKLLTELTGHRGAFVALCVGLGIRRSEALTMVPSQLNLDKWEAFIAGTKTDGSRRWVPILSPFRALVEAAKPYLPLQPWKNLSRDLNAACRRAGVPRVTPNDLRRSQATMLAEAGVPPDVIRRLLGHTTAKLVEQVYARPRAAILGEQAEVHLQSVRQVEPAARCDKNATVTLPNFPPTTNLAVFPEPPSGLEPETYGLRTHNPRSLGERNEQKTPRIRLNLLTGTRINVAKRAPSVLVAATETRQSLNRLALAYAAASVGVLA